MADVNLWVTTLPAMTALAVGLVLFGAGLWLRRRGRKASGGGA
jgi:LPXTG-motif cell wall-anchored protein